MIKTILQKPTQAALPIIPISMFSKRVPLKDVSQLDKERFVICAYISKRGMFMAKSHSNHPFSRIISAARLPEHDKTDVTNTLGN